MHANIHFTTAVESQQRAIRHPLWQPEPMTRREQESLKRVQAEFCEQAVMKLTPLLRSRLVLRSTGLQCRTYRNYLDDRDPESPLLHFSLDGGGRAYFSTPLCILLDLFDALMGGVGRLDLAREPYLTEIETHMLRPLMRALLAAYAGAFRHHQFAPQFETDYAEFNPYKLPICGLSEAVIVAIFQLETPATRGPLELVLPWAPLRNSLEVQTTTQQSPPVHIPPRTPLQLALRLGQAELLFQDLADLRTGDCIRLDQPVTEPVTVTVNGCPKFRGFPGFRQGQLAVRVTERVRPG